MPSFARRIATTALLVTGLLLPASIAQAAPAKATYRSGNVVGAQAALGSSVERPTLRARSTQVGCENADLAPTSANEPLVRAAVLCLHNEIRTQNGLPVLRENARLRKAAAGHSADMVSRRFFEHTTPAGVTMIARIMSSRYVPRNAGWAAGENLGWGTGTLATPRGVVQAWMKSAGHRANILKRAYREIGIGVATGTPTGAAAGATYTTDFGVVRR